jgi:hypothetical protein
MTHDVVALRGVCIGPGQHLQPGQRTTLDAAAFRFLSGIGAVQPAPAEAAPEPTPQPVAPAKPARREN